MRDVLARRAGATTATTPGALSGSAAVIASLQLVVDRRQVADQDFVGIDRAGRQHLHAGDGDAGVVLGDHLQIGIVALLAGKQVGALAAARRRHGEAEVEVVLAREVVVAQQVLPEALVQAVEQARVHRKPGDQPRHLVRRTADEAVGHVGDRLHGAHAPRQIVARCGNAANRG